jgi:hypothetical protein
VHDPATGRPRRVIGYKNNINNDGGSLVPLVVSWPSVVKQPATIHHLIDFTDFCATFIELANAPELPVCDGHSFAGLLGDTQDWTPRPFVFVQRQHQWYVRSAGFRLNGDGSLLDMSDAPFRSAPVDDDSGGDQATTAKACLQSALDAIAPEEGITYEYSVNKKNKDAAGKWKAENWDWKVRWDGTVSGDDADPDGDGVRNAEERTRGTDPNRADRPGGQGARQILLKRLSGDASAPMVSCYGYYGAMGRPLHLMADHGVPKRDNSKRQLPVAWVRHQDNSGTAIRKASARRFVARLTPAGQKARTIRRSVRITSDALPMGR